MARLLHGSTDLLQPINLLPNSDFSMSGGYPATQSFAILNSSKQGLCHGFNVYANIGETVLSNVTTTRAVNNLRFQGTYSSGQRLGFRLECSSDFKASIHKIYTTHIKIIDNTKSLHLSDILYLGINTAATMNTYYKVIREGKESNTFEAIGIVSPTTDSSTFYVNIGIPVSKGSIDVTVSDLCIYEGAYTNPPIYKSLDVQPSNQFELKNRLVHQTITSKPAQGAGWKILCRLYDTASQACHTVQFSIGRMFNVSSGTNQFIGSLSWYIHTSTKLCKFTKYSSFYTSSSENLITKLRLTRDDSTGETYLECYYNSGIGNDIRFSIMGTTYNEEHISVNDYLKPSKSGVTVVGSEYTIDYTN